MIKREFIWLIVSLLLIACFCAACSQKPDEKKVVARINDYVMTVKDLKEEIEHAPYSAKQKQNLEEALDLAIRKQILIQEAQRRGLDRKKSFMQTIERYWEQTLIKELIKEQSLKVYKSSATMAEKDKALDVWMDGLYQKAKIKIYRNALKGLERR